MKNLNLRAFLLSLLGTLSFFIGCVRNDPPSPENYLKYPLEVKAVELPDGSMRLSWNVIKSADFIEYQVIRNSGDSVPFIPDESINNLAGISKTLDLAIRITEADSSFFVDSLSVPITKSFLRVFAVMQGRNLSSRNIELASKTDAKEVEIDFSDAMYVPENKKFVLSQQNATSFIDNRLLVFDYQTNIQSVAIPNSFASNTFELVYGRFNNNTEIFVSRGGVINFRNINAPLVETNTFTFNNDALFYEKNANFFFTVSSQPVTIRLYNRANIAVNGNSTPIFTTGFQLTQKIQNQYVFRAAPNNREIIALSTTNGSNHVLWLKYDIDGRNIAKINNINLTPPDISKRPFAIAPDNQNFITTGKGLIYNRNLGVADSLKLPHLDTRYRDMIFSADGAYLYAARAGIERREKFVDVYTYPNYKFERSIAFRSTPTRIFQAGTELFLVGRSPNNIKKTMIEKIKL